MLSTDEAIAHEEWLRGEFDRLGQWAEDRRLERAWAELECVAADLAVKDAAAGAYWFSAGLVGMSMSGR